MGYFFGLFISGLCGGCGAVVLAFLLCLLCDVIFPEEETWEWPAPPGVWFVVFWTIKVHLFIAGVISGCIGYAVGAL